MTARVFTPTIVVFSALILTPSSEAARLHPETLAAWEQHVARREQQLGRDEPWQATSRPEGRSLPVCGGTVHEWQGTVRIPNIRVRTLVHALTTPGLPPSSPEIVDARVLARRGDALLVYMRVTRSALVTITYDMEHEVRFEHRAPGLATSRSVATTIREVDGEDHGFLWRLNSYWRYRQDGPDVVVDLVSLSLSREIPAMLRPVAGPLANRIARESVQSALAAVARLGRALPACISPCPRDGDDAW